MGPDERKYNVHKAVLCQSPVFAALCDSKFKEAENNHIELPEDDPTDFGVLIHYLYVQKFDTKATQEEPGDLADELADMYITADKYQLNLLKALTVKKFRAAKTLSSSAQALFPAARRIYDNVPDSEVLFKAYFRSVAPSCLSKIPAGEQSKFLDDTELDGQFGKHVAAAFFGSLQSLRTETSITNLQSRLTAAADETIAVQGQLDAANTATNSAQARLNAARNRHANSHYTCRHCL